MCVLAISICFLQLTSDTVTIKLVLCWNMETENSSRVFISIIKAYTCTQTKKENIHNRNWVGIE